MVDTIKKWFEDNKNRSLFYQFITILLFIYVGHFFFSNTVTNLERQKIANIVHEASLGDKKGINDAIKRKIKETVDFKMNIENVD